MIQPTYYQTVEGGFDWYGLAVSEHGNILRVEEGRIGITDNPLCIVDDTVDGGYYLPTTEIVYGDGDKTIDLLLNVDDEEIYVMVRSDDANEQYDGDQFRLLLTLAIRQSDDEPWLIATPLRENV